MKGVKVNVPTGVWKGRRKIVLILFYATIFSVLLQTSEQTLWGMSYHSLDLAHKGEEHEKYENGNSDVQDNHETGGIEEYDEKEKIEEVSGGKGSSLKTTSEIILDPGRIFSHMHNKIVHFPIALGIISGVFDILSFFNPSLSQAGKIILAFTTAGAVGAFISGKAIEEEMEGEYTESYEGVLEIHEALGLLAMSIYIIAFLLRLSPKTDKLSKLIVILSLPLISFVGYLGGILAH